VLTTETVMAGKPGFFELSDRYETPSAAGDPLERLTAVVDFEVSPGTLVAALWRSIRGKGSRPLFDPVLMFKVLVLQALYSLSDQGTEFQNKDRWSFQRFLELGARWHGARSVDSLIVSGAALTGQGNRSVVRPLGCRAQG